jgi:outer membrane protein
VGSIKGAYWPSLGISTGLTEGGRQLNNLVWNWNAGATLTWQLFQGGLTNAQVDEARANLVGLDAQIETLRQQIRVDVEQARLSVRATKAVLVASDEVVINARERLRLAEGRYATGVGNGIELADAQLALTSALAQRIQAEYNLAAARANLVHALGM